ncbi:MAG: hypothetical protein JWO96_829 [Candidatus Saccharibacteria bacterium]|nr:hypothetical protein [Candidatus Saccharibacteria bacterium]
MKGRAWLAAISGVILFLIFLGIGSRTMASTEFMSGNSVTVAGNETLDYGLWVGGRNVSIAGTINGDLFCGAQTVDISGTVKGDVICGAQTITISGTVEGSVRLGAQTVNLNGDIARSASVAAQTVNIDSKSRIGMDASFAASSLNINGTVGRDLAIAASNVNISGQVARDITGTADRITLARGAKVGGGIEYTSKNKIAIDNGATVGGAVSQHQPKEKAHPALSSLLFGLGVAIVLLITALIVTTLLPQLVHLVAVQGIRRPWRALLTGLVASILIPILAVLLMVTIVGLPLGILLLISWLLIGLTSGLFTAYYIGLRIWPALRNPLLIVLAGGVILLILYLIPFVGFFVMLLAYWMGAGMVLLALTDHTPPPSYRIDRPGRSGRSGPEARYKREPAGRGFFIDRRQRA